MMTLMSFLRQLSNEWIKDDLPRRSAAIAFYAILSFPALVLVILTITGWIIGERTAIDALLAQASYYVDAETLSFVESIVRNVREQQQNTAVGMLGFTFLFFSALNVIRELRQSLNGILRVTKPARSWNKNFWGYAVSLLVLLVMSALIIIFVFTEVTVLTIGERLRDILPIPGNVLSGANHALTYAGLIAVFSMLYRILPYQKFPFIPIVLCSVIASSILIIGTIVLSYGVSLLDIGRAYGVAASLLILMLWIYFASAVFLVGAEALEAAVHQNIQPKRRI